MKTILNKLNMVLISVLATAGISIFVRDYVDDQNNQIWLLSHKTISLLEAIGLSIVLLLLSLILLNRNKTVKKISKINHNTQNKSYDHITRKQKKILKNLSEDEKYYLRQFYDKDDRTLMFEPNATLNELCDKDILEMGPALIDTNAGHSQVSYSMNKWAWYYLKENRHLLV